MKYTYLLTLLFTFQIISGFSQQTEKPYVPGEILIQPNGQMSIKEILRATPHTAKLQIKKKVSKNVNIWLLEFNDERHSHDEVMRMLKATGGIKLMQNNHYVQHRGRAVPNDTDFGDQWHHVNTGQTGGTSDADIDTDEAWDITTGGTSALGDEIVVCVVEGPGADYTHTDLTDNFWVNTQEIPDNGVDDDGNGYVDDYEGWRTDNNSDNHQLGGHGTQCMGMIGATGNNSMGVAGANWDVKMMLVSGFSTQEASVLEAYDYPLTMRKMYNSSNGQNGAFVVATSASWGIDGADPSNYPLWCAMYDTLGIHGVLNVGATTNSNFDVDAGGDMPTACASDYMISVTRTGASDEQAGGYGANTIDFGAPGIDVYTTSGGGGYGTTTGTSFSCPLTAGVIGLLYSAPCASFMSIAKADPEQGSIMIRDALMQGVDQVSSMNGISVTGGRLNANNSLTILMNNCSASSCITPFNLTSYGTTDTETYLAWNNAGASDDFWVFYRDAGANEWDSTMVSNDTIFIDTLTACSSYEFMVRSVCGAGDESENSDIYTLDTDGCCEPPNELTVSNIMDNSADLTWPSVLAATAYHIRYREQGAGTWTDISNVTSPYTLTGLDSCTWYEVEIQTECAGSQLTSYMAADDFKTSGCGACTDLTYCASDGQNSADEWIESVLLESIDNTSGDDGGYADYTDFSTLLNRGSTYDIELTPGFNAGSGYDESFSVWIDYNQDGDFDDNGELVFDNGGNTTQVMVTGQITVPGTATLGYTRMRVSMKYNSAPTSCESFNYGEVEDYCVQIEDALACSAAFTASATIGDVSFTDVSSNASTWDWDFDDGNTSTNQNPTHSFAANGNYNVCLTITDGAGCSDTYCDDVNIQGVSVEEEENYWGVTLFPNPVRNEVTIYIRNDQKIADGVSLNIYNSVGQVIDQEKMVTNKITKTMNNHPDGIYFIELRDQDGHSIRKRIIKQ